MKHIPIEKKKKSRFCLELLIGEIITILLFCKIVLFASFSSHFSRHCSWVRLRRRQNFPCDSAWHPAVLFPLQSCQTLSAVWKKKKMLWGFPYYHPRSSQKCQDFFCKHLSDGGILGRWTQTFALTPLSSGLATRGQVSQPLHQALVAHGRTRISLFLFSLSICLLLADGGWRTNEALTL